MTSPDSRPPRWAGHRPRLRVADLVDEALAGALSRPLRASFTVLASALGIAALLATLGTTQTAAAQLLARFDAVAAVEVVVTTADPARPGAHADGARLPFDAEHDLTRLRGVVAAGTVALVDVGGAQVSTMPPGSAAASFHELHVFAASTGLLSAVRGRVATGRWLDPVHDTRAERVVVLGARAAARLGVTRTDQLPVVFIGDAAYTVIGVLDRVAREHDLLGGLIIPQGTAVERFGLVGPDRVVIETEPGAATLIGRQAPLALAPNEPTRLVASVPPDLSELRRAAERDVDALYLVLGTVALIVGALGIANTTLVSVYERSGEISLRRSLGARPGHVVLQFLMESAVLGAIGGLVGTAAGVVTVVVTALLNGWHPVLSPPLILAAPVVGLVVGLVAGAYPAGRAGAVEPAEGLREGV